MPVVYADSCDQDGNCDTNCVDGDLDCSCELMKGDACSEGENCNGNLLKNFKNEICCSVECTPGKNLSADGNIKYFVSGQEEAGQKQNERETEAIKKENILEEYSFAFTFTLIALAMVTTMYLMHKRNVEFMHRMIPNKSRSTKLKAGDFLEYITMDLNKNEEKIINFLLENDSTSIYEISNNLKISSETLRQNLLKLKKRQIIRIKGNIVYLNELFKQF